MAITLFWKSVGIDAADTSGIPVNSKKTGSPKRAKKPETLSGQTVGKIRKATTTNHSFG